MRASTERSQKRRAARNTLLEAKKEQDALKHAQQLEKAGQLAREQAHAQEIAAEGQAVIDKAAADKLTSEDQILSESDDIEIIVVGSDTDQSLDEVNTPSEAVISTPGSQEVQESEKPNYELNEPVMTSEVVEKTPPVTQIPSTLLQPERNIRTVANTSEVDQQKFQKQMESIKYAALTYKERGKPEKYEQKLVEWLSIDQENQEFMTMLADHYFMSGNYVKALTLLKKVIIRMPENHKAIWQIGRIYQSQAKPDAAQLLIEKALEKKPDHPKYLISLVEIHYDKSELRKALSVMERLRKLRPTNIDYLLTVATLHEELNELTFAKNYYMKILEIEPYNEHAKAGMKNL